MKISNQLLFDRGAQQMSAAQTKLAQLQAQLSQGKQVVNPSDAPDKAAAILRLNSVMGRQASYQATLSAFGGLSSALSSFQGVAQSLADPGRFQGVKASVSDAAVISASAANNAAPGTYSIEVSLDPWLRPGMTVDLVDVQPGLTRRLYLTEVRHHIGTTWADRRTSMTGVQYVDP